MIFLLDGSNILGRLGLDRHSVEAKRTLVRAAAALARQRKARVLCVFDGSAEGSFATSLGSVMVTFASPRDADSVLVEEAERITNEAVTIVTSDSGLARKVRRRRVEVARPQILQVFLEERSTENKLPAEDWERYFSDPKNRNV